MTDSTEGALNHIDELKRRLLRTLSVLHKGPLNWDMTREIERHISYAVTELEVAEEILSQPPLPTKLGAVITNVKARSGAKYTHAVLLDPEDKMQWFCGHRNAQQWNEVWVQSDDILSFKLAYEGIKEGKDD